MSTLVLAMALCTAPGHAPAAVSAATVQPLNFVGTWKGTVTLQGGTFPCEIFPSNKGMQSAWHMGEGNFTLVLPWKFLDEGDGKMRLVYDERSALGIYRWEGSQLILCIRQPDRGRPRCFQAGEVQDVYILRRVKSR